MSDKPDVLIVNREMYEGLVVEVERLRDLLARDVLPEPRVTLTERDVYARKVAETVQQAWLDWLAIMEEGAADTGNDAAARAHRLAIESVEGNELLDIDAIIAEVKT